MKKWSVVIIGRDESKHLRNCILSVKRALERVGGGEIIYVDSSSKDDSVKIALSEGITVIETNFPRPNASISRNVGAKYARGEYIHFIDADIYMDESYLVAAERVLEKRKDVSLVCGQLVEAKLNRMTSYFATWTEEKVGYLDYPIGGGGSFRLKDFLDIGGYNINLVRGQETELGYRMRQRGYKIYGIRDLMGVHHLEANDFFGFIDRVKRMALAYSYVLFDKDYSHNKLFFNQAKRNLIQAIFLIILFVILVLFQSYVFPLYSIFLIIIVLILLIFVLLKKRKTLFYIEKLLLIFFQFLYLFKFKLHSYPRNSDDINLSKFIKFYEPS